MSSAFLKYDPTSRLLHWLNAAVILWATISGLLISFGFITSTFKHAIAEFNVSLTTVLIPFFVWRIVNTIRKPRPGYKAPLSDMHITLAHAMHITLYALTAVVLISGVLRMTAPFSVFHIVTLPNLVSTPSLLDSFDTLHIFSCRLLAVCVLLHVLAVIKHHMNGVNVLSRMT